MLSELMVVNYHYIRDFFPSRGIYGIFPVNFVKQLGLIRENGFSFTSLRELNDAIINCDYSKLHTKSCLITFDDGLRESYEIGFPLLEREGIDAAFFVSSATTSGRRVLPVHKYHLIQSVLSDQEIAKKISIVGMDAFPSSDIDARAQYPWDTLESARLKYFLNFKLSFSEKEVVIDDLFKECGVGETKYAAELYLSKAQILELARLGNLASHAITHQPLAQLGQDEMEFELHQSRSDLNLFAGNLIESVSYPFGGETAVNGQVIEAAKKAGYISGFTMQRGVNNLTDIIKNPLSIKRYDSNDIYGGKSDIMNRGG